MLVDSSSVRPKVPLFFVCGRFVVLCVSSLLTVGVVLGIVCC